MFGSVEMSAPEGKQMRLLREWILELACTILAELSVQSDGSRAHSRTNVSQSGKGRAEERQDGLMNDLFLDLETSSKGTMSKRRKGGSSVGTSFHMGNRRQNLYKYFVKYVLAVRIWCDDSFALFKELKTPVQVFMNQLAGKCHARMRQLILDSDGQQLCSFVWGTERASSCDHFGLAGSDQAHVPQLQMDVRQDDDQVQAIRLHSSDVEEAQLERLTPSLRYAIASAGLQVDADETVFITQLHRRGKLLDKMFKSAVMDALASTYEQPMSDGVNDSSAASSNYQHSPPYVSTFPTTASSAALEHVTISEAPNQVMFRPGGIASGLARYNGACDVEEGHTFQGLPEIDETEDTEKNRDGAETWTTGEGDVVHVPIGLFSDGPRSVQVHLAPIKTQVL